MIGKGLLKIDDYYKFGKLIETLEEHGAYLITYSPKKNTILAWFKGGPNSEQVKTIINYLKENKYEYSIVVGKNANWTMVRVGW